MIMLAMLILAACSDSESTIPDINNEEVKKNATEEITGDSTPSEKSGSDFVEKEDEVLNDEEKDEADMGVPVGGGNNGPEYRFFPWEIGGVSIGGPVQVEGCFIHDRFDEAMAVIDKYDALLKTIDSELEKSYYSNFMWHMTQELDLTREDLELYNESVSTESYRLTDEQIDALLIEDIEEARKALRSPYTLYSEVDNNIYRVVDIEKLTEAEFKALEFSTEDVQRFTAAIAESDEVTVSLSFVNEICEMAGIEPIAEEVAY